MDCTVNTRMTYTTLRRLLESTLPPVNWKLSSKCTPDSQDIAFFGYVVQMRPSQFLKLAAPLSEPTNDYVEARIRAGDPLCPPYLKVNFKADIPTIVSHEGRNRLTLIMRLYETDDPISVQILAQYMKARDITPEMKAAFQERAVSETGNIVTNNHA